VNWSERAARNEALFREVNERIATAGAGLDASLLKVLCECSRTSCAETLEIDAEEYHGVRDHGARFALLAEHVDPAIEEVVVDGTAFVVVEKREPGAEVARRLDPRSRSS
jgi:hypothetical protein